MMIIRTVEETEPMKAEMMRQRTVISEGRVHKMSEKYVNEYRSSASFDPRSFSHLTDAEVTNIMN